MKQTICGLIIFGCIFLIAGLAGGVDCGQPLSNMLWCVPLLLVMLVSTIIGDFI